MTTENILHTQFARNQRLVRIDLLLLSLRIRDYEWTVLDRRTGNAAGVLSPKVEAITALRSQAFVDDYRPYLRSMPH